MAEARSQSRRQAVQAAAAILLLERRNKLGLAAAVAVPVRHILNVGGDPATTERTIVMVASLAVAKMMASASSASRKHWGTFAGLEAAGASPVAVNRPVEDAKAIGAAWRRAFEKSMAESPAGSTSIKELAAEALETVRYRIDRLASFETLRAWNEETTRQNDLAHSLGYTVIETWIADLDARTCARCAAMSGETVIRPEAFTEPPPLHGHCRCFLSTQIT